MRTCRQLTTVNACRGSELQRWNPRCAFWNEHMELPVLARLVKLLGLSRNAADVRELPHSRVEPFHAVSIVPGEHSCDSARRLSGQRFLSPEAPKLPLSTCDAQECHCHYRHHADRRAGPRRSNDFFMRTTPWQGQERRISRGRRKDDTE
jgi:hypothetical protein